MIKATKLRPVQNNDNDDDDDERDEKSDKHNTTQISEYKSSGNKTQRGVRKEAIAQGREKTLTTL